MGGLADMNAILTLGAVADGFDGEIGNWEPVEMVGCAHATPTTDMSAIAIVDTAAMHKMRDTEFFLTVGDALRTGRHFTGMADCRRSAGHD